MGIFNKIRRHAAIAGGNFKTMFKGVEIPPLPLAVQRLIAEINKENPDIDELAKLISSSTGIAAKVIKTANSSYYSPRKPITQIKQAVMFLGLKNIRSLTMAFAVMDSIPSPKGSTFDHQAFWIDSLLRAFLSRNLTPDKLKSQKEEAFTASLISDLAIPVLLSVWSEYYTAIAEQWLQSPKHLSDLEREQFGWDHAQAGAWIVQSWGFPDELICYIGAHNLALTEIMKLELDDTIILPMAIAALSPSILKTDDMRGQEMYATVVNTLGLSSEEFVQMIEATQTGFNEMLTLFGLPDRGANNTLEQMAAIAQSHDQEPCA